MQGYHVIDTPNDCSPNIVHLQADGITTVIRYLDRRPSWKTIGPDEAHALAAAGIKVALVFEHDGRPHGDFAGEFDGEAAVRMAQRIGAPRGAVIWYAVDYDPSPDDVIRTIAAFKAFGNVVHAAGFRVGAYCGGYCATKLIEADAVDLSLPSGTPLSWITQSMGFHGTRDFLKTGQWCMVQKLDAHLARMDVDPDVVAHTPNGDAEIGNFIPFEQESKK